MRREKIRQWRTINTYIKRNHKLVLIEDSKLQKKPESRREREREREREQGRGQ